MNGRRTLLAVAAAALVAVPGCTSGHQTTNPAAPAPTAATPTASTPDPAAPAASVPAASSAAPAVVESFPAKRARGSNHAEYVQLDRGKGIIPPLIRSADEADVAQDTCDNSPQAMAGLVRSLAAANAGAAHRAQLEQAVSDRSSLITAYCVPKEMVSWVAAVQAFDITLDPYASFR